MKRHWSTRLVSYPLALLVAFLVLLPTKALYDNYQQEIGRRDAELAILRPKVATLQNRVDSLERTLKPQLRVTYRTKTVWDTLPPLIPDLLKPEAEPVPAKVLANVILIGQEAVQSCHVALGTCLALQTTKDSIIDLRGREIGILKARISSRWDGLVQWGFRLGFFWLGTQVR